jgi:dihydrofolate reductase
MRKVVVFEFLSVDGVAEDPDRFFSVYDDVVDQYLGEVIATQDAVILGRETYDGWAGFWPKSDIEPFATFINAAPKYIATSKPLEQEWSNSTPIHGDLVSFVQELKSQGGGDIGVHASISIAQALLAAGVVDELKLSISPWVLTSGRRLLDGMPAGQLELIRSASSPSGYLIADYRITK